MRAFNIEKKLNIDFPKSNFTANYRIFQAFDHTLIKMLKEIQEINASLDGLIGDLKKKCTVDDDVIAAFSKLHDGVRMLHCKHCHGDKPLEAFRGSIEKVMAKGSNRIPKTCDKMQATNKKANPLNNPIYNAEKSLKKINSVIGTFKEKEMAVPEELVVKRIETVVKFADAVMKKAKSKKI